MAISIWGWGNWLNIFNDVYLSFHETALPIRKKFPPQYKGRSKFVSFACLCAYMESVV